MVNNPPAMMETWVPSLSHEDPLGKGIATHSSIPVLRTPIDRGAERDNNSFIILLLKSVYLCGYLQV